MSMTSNRPYLIRAFYDWIVDNDCTPYVVVDAFFPGVEAPEQYVNDGQIVLNLAPRAVSDFELDHELIQFNTRFGGVPTDIRLPTESILGIYARENGQGMVFQPESPDEDPEGPEPPERPLTPVDGKGEGKSDSKAPRPSLRVVK